MNTPITFPLYRHLAMLIEARANCKKNGNTEWYQRHLDTINDLLGDHAPSGSGIDNGAPLQINDDPTRLEFRVDFHHMNGAGFYDGWTEHRVIVRPSLAHGIDIRITGPNRNDIKEYLHQVFEEFLTRPLAYPLNLSTETSNAQS